MRSSSILEKLITLASIVGIVAAQRNPSMNSTAFPINGTGVIPTTCTASWQCRSQDLGGTTTNLPTTSSPSRRITFPRTLSLGEGNIVPVRETSITKNVLTGWSKSDTSSPLTGGDPTSTGPSGGDATTISSSTPTGSTSSTTKSDSTPTSSTGATTKSDSTPAGGTGATTKPGSIPQPADGTGAITESQSTPTGGTGTTTKSESTPTGGTGATTKSESTPTGGTDSGSSSGSGSGSRGSSGGTVAPAATFTAPGGSTGVAARNGGSVVALVLLGSLVGLLGSR